jgi:signal transduction histidine kinase
VIEPLTLASSALVSLCIAATIYRRAVPGSKAFALVTLATAEWSLTSLGEWQADSVAGKLFWAKAEYIGIVSLAPLIWAFACDYAGKRWARRPSALAVTWIIPAITVAVAFTNERHRMLWTTVTLTERGAAIFGHGWWFGVIQVYSHLLLLAGFLLLLRAVRRSPLYRTQSVALVGAVVAPWVANILYAARLTPFPSIDPTPPAFALSGLLMARALMRDRLFDLVPVARDQVIENLSDAVIVVDDDGSLLDMNPMARRLSPDTAGWPWRQVGHVLPFLSGIALDASTSGLTVPVTVGEDERWYEMRVTRVGESGEQSAAWAVLLRDVTDQRNTEARRAALDARFLEQQQRDRLSFLTGGLAHDFNDLLAGIRGNADVLAAKLSPMSDMGSSVNAILLGAERASDLVSKMLAYAGERDGAGAAVDLDAVVREMLHLVKAPKGTRGTLTYSGAPASIVADPVQMRQVAMNLIMNAYEAVDPVSGVVAVSVGTGSLTADAIASMRSGDDVTPGDYAYLEVRDNGPGMDADTLSNIFTPFFTTKSAGHGLGLPVVQGIIRGHRGALYIETAKGKGCRFRAWFPTGGPRPEAHAPDPARDSRRSSMPQLPRRTTVPVSHGPSGEGTPAARKDR